MSMKSIDALKSRLGANMRESMGVDRRADVPATPVGTPTRPAGPAKFEGTAALKRAMAVPLDRIVPDPDQPRKEFDAAAIAELAESLKARGQLQPVRVRWDEAGAVWVLISGERRYRAAVLAGLPTIQCVEAKGDMTADEVLEDQLVENCLREDLKPVEQASAFKSLMESRGLSYRQLAERLHISAAAVSQALSLLKLPVEVQERVDAGDLASTVAYELTKIGEADEQAELAARVVADGLSRAEVVEEVKRRSAAPRRAKGRGAKPRKVTSRVIRTAAGPRVTIEHSKGLTAESARAALVEALGRIEAEGGAETRAA